MPNTPIDSEPSVSICIPVYNREKMVRTAIESAIAQGIAGMEVLVVDNASTDGTWDAICSYPAPVRGVRNPTNLGICGNFNRCLDLARGPFVCLVSSDNRLVPGSIARELAWMQARPSLAMVCGQGEVFDDRGRRLYVSADHLEPGVYPEGEDTVVNLLWILAAYGYNPLNYPDGILLRTAHVRRAGTFDAKMVGAFDLDFLLRMLQHGELGILSEYTCEIVEHRSSEGQNVLRSGDIMTGKFRMYQRWQELLQQRGVERIMLAHLGARCLWYVVKQLAAGEARSACRYLVVPHTMGNGYGPAAVALLKHLGYRLRRRYGGVRLSRQHPLEGSARA